MKKVLTELIVISFLFTSQTTLKAQNKFGNDHYNFIDVNELKMWISNNGSSSHNQPADVGGLLWRSGIYPNSSLVFQSHIMWAGIIDREILAGGGKISNGLQAGRILSQGKPDQTARQQNRVFKLTKDWKDLPAGELKSTYQKNFNEWPVESGAPWIDKNNDGVFTREIDEPEIIGDEILWYVSNDLDTARVSSSYGSFPIGIEVQTTVFAFNRTNVLGRTIFEKYKIINKSNKTVQKMYIGVLSDPDLGYLEDDYIGCDTLLNMAYCYNADNNDNNNFKTNPPCIGYVLLQGPIVKSNSNKTAYINGRWLTDYENLGLKSFTYIIRPDFPIEQYHKDMEYFYLNGLQWNGNPIIDPLNNEVTHLSLAGDPVNKTGWFEGEGWPEGPEPGDRRMVLGTGPFNFAPGDTQEVVIATIVAQGKDNIDAITELKADSRRIQYFYNGKTLPTNVEEENVIEGFSLSQNFPNPFNPSTKIQISIPSVRANCSSPLQIRIYDILGNEVAVMTKEIINPGEYEIELDAEKYNLSSGVYFYQARIDDFIATKKMCLIK
ncbi:MAG: T9SS C-terminal target domain-containing protein [Ignavibacteriales bacterium]|nr:MAG: T9SS C-terminal target domain-containing protein [Ignavibacteriales bacterium]